MGWTLASLAVRDCSSHTDFGASNLCMLSLLMFRLQWPVESLGGARYSWCENEPHPGSLARTVRKYCGLSGDALGQYSLNHSSSHVNLSTYQT